MAQAVGIVSILWVGQNIPVEKGAKMVPGGLMAKAVVLNGTIDQANEYKEGKVTCVTRLIKGQSLIGLRNGGKPGELQYSTDTGQTYVDPAAFISNMPSVTGGDGGKVDMEWTIGEPTELIS